MPNDPTQVMYVWFEAITNYITVLGYPEHEDFKTFWPANVQIIGKDILRFHAAIWPGMLFGLNLPLPQTLYVHGFINIDGKKLSKSLGNYVTPQEVIAKYGVDALRYYLLRHIPAYEDGDFSWDRFETVYNNELANELGNALQRVVAMVVKYQNGIIGTIPPSKHDTAGYYKAIEDCRFDKALEEVWEQVRGLNQYIDDSKPWVLAKEKDEQHLQEVLAQAASDLIQIGQLLKPFMPETGAKIQAALSEGVVRQLGTTLFPKHEETKPAPSRQQPTPTAAPAKTEPPKA